MRKTLLLTTAVALLSGCSAAYTCEHGYGLTMGTTKFSNCVSALVQEQELNIQRSIVLMQFGAQLMQVSRPHYAPSHSCQGYVQPDGSFSADCN